MHCTENTPDFHYNVEIFSPSLSFSLSLFSLPRSFHTQLVGLALIGGGSYIVHTGANFDIFTGSNYFSGAVLIIVAGCITTIITCVGILGGIFLSKFLLGFVSTVMAHVDLCMHSHYIQRPSNPHNPDVMCAAIYLKC